MTSLRITAANRPDFSATATPRSATSTTPSGAKPVKLVTKPSTMRRSPSAESRFTTSIMPSAARPAVPSGRGSATLKSIQESMPLATSTASANSANNETGWGNRLPSHSTVSRKRVNAPLFTGAAAAPASVAIPCPLSKPEPGFANATTENEGRQAPAAGRTDLARRTPTTRRRMYDVGRGSGRDATTRTTNCTGAA
jgi:hypothetical protein